MGPRERQGLEFLQRKLLCCCTLRTLGDALHTQEPLHELLHAPDKAGLAVRIAWRVAVEQYLRLQTPVASLAFSAYHRVTGVLWGGCSRVG